MASYIREMRGIPLWLLKEYLEALGGKAADDGYVAGAGWTACLTQLADFKLGSLSVGQVRLEVQADEDGWRLLQPVLEKKLLRAGG